MTYAATLLASNPASKVSAREAAAARRDRGSAASHHCPLSGSVEAAAPAAFELRFPSLDASPSVSFPCDVAGRVDMNGLSERARANYLRVRALVGRDFAWPMILSCPAKPCRPGHPTGS
jgi:hypothetical protein